MLRFLWRVNSLICWKWNVHWLVIIFWARLDFFPPYSSNASPTKNLKKNMKNILWTEFYKLYSIHCILCIVFYVLYYMHCMLYIVFYLLYALHVMHCILCIVFYAFYTMHCTLCIVLYALCSVELWNSLQTNRPATKSPSLKWPHPSFHNLS